MATETNDKSAGGAGAINPTTEAHPLAVTCPACKALAGEECHFVPYRPGRKVSYHLARVIRLRATTVLAPKRVGT
jgi:hypothetical protein